MQGLLALCNSHLRKTILQRIEQFRGIDSFFHKVVLLRDRLARANLREGLMFVVGLINLRPSRTVSYTLHRANETVPDTV